jgi:predicted nucleic acid-binding protein
VSAAVLVDTSALLAIANPRDQYHKVATALARRHLAAGGRFAGSTLVLAELHGHLLYRRGPEPARRVLDALLSDQAYTWHDVSAELMEGALSQWLEGFHDQRFSLTDAVSFELMRTLRIRVAFAYDDDFRVAGFETLD